MPVDSQSEDNSSENHNDTTNHVRIHDLYVASQTVTPETSLILNETAVSEICAELSALAPPTQAKPLPAEPLAKALQPGDSLGRFQLKRRLGLGGMGSVFLASDPALGRDVALKLPHPELLTIPAARERFLREAHATAILSHPNIVTVYESEQTDGLCYIASEFCNGPTLHEWIRYNDLSANEKPSIRDSTSLFETTVGNEVDLSDVPTLLNNRDAERPAVTIESEESAAQFKPVPQRTAAAILHALADAMAHAHARGILHRDLKPANILLQPCEKPVPADDFQGFAVSDLNFLPRITDFGLARISESDSSDETLTRTGATLGTAAYMSPEQARGESSTLDDRSDIFSLGVILYELLTGRRAFKRPNQIATMQAVEREELIPVSRVVRSVSRDLEAITARCLEKDRNQRYPTSRDLAHDLERFLRGQPVSARRITTTSRMYRWCMRNRALAALIAAVASLLIAIAVFGYATGVEKSALAEEKTTLASQERIARKDAEAQKEIAQDERNRARSAEQQARNQQERAERLLYAGQIRLAQTEWNFGNRSFARMALDRCRRDLRGWEHDYLYSGLQTGSRMVYGHAEGLTSVRFSPDGKHLVTAGQDGIAMLVDANTGRALTRLDHQDRRNSTRLTRLGVTSAIYSADGKTLVTTTTSGEIQIRETDSLQLLHTLSRADDRVETSALSSDSQILATAYRSGDIHLWDVASGQHLRVLNNSGKRRQVLSLCFCQQDALLCSGGADRSLRFWDVSTGAAKGARLTGHTGAVTGLACSPDQSKIASSSTDETIRIWDIAARELKQTLEGHTARVNCVAWSDSGRLIASGASDRTVRIWEPENQTQPLRLTLSGQQGLVRAVDFQADESKVASAGDNEVAVLWDLNHLIDSDADDYELEQPIPAFCQTASGATVMAQGPTFVAFPPGKEQATHLEYRPHARNISALCAAGNQILSAGFDGQICVWDLEKNEPIQVFKHPAAVRAIAVSHDGSRVVGGDRSGNLILWDLATGQEIRRWQHATEAENALVTDVVFHPHDRDVFASVGVNQILHIWHADDDAPRQEIAVHDTRVLAMSFHPDGNQIATGGIDKNINVWDVATGGRVNTFVGHLDRVTALAFHPDGSRLFSGSRDKTIKIWDTLSGRGILDLHGHRDAVTDLLITPQLTLYSAGADRRVLKWVADQSQEPIQLAAYSGQISDLVFRPRNHDVFVSGTRGTIGQFDIKTGREEQQIEVSVRVRAMATNPQETHMVVSLMDPTLRVYDSETAAIVAESTLTDICARILFLDDNRFATANRDGSIQFWSLSPLELECTISAHSERVMSLTLAKNDILVSGSAGTDICLWNASDGSEIGRIETNRRIIDVVWCESIQRLAWSSIDSKIRMLNLETREQEGELNTPSTFIKSMHVSPDERYLAGLGDDNRIVIFDLRSSQIVAQLSGHTDRLIRGAFTGTGHFVSGANDGTMRLWDLSKAMHEYKDSE